MTNKQEGKVLSPPEPMGYIIIVFVNGKTETYTNKTKVDFNDLLNEIVDNANHDKGNWYFPFIVLNDTHIMHHQIVTMRWEIDRG